MRYRVVSSNLKSSGEAIKRENDEVKLSSLSKEIADLKEEETRYKAKWEAERNLHNKIQQNKIEIENLRFEADRAEREGNYEKVARYVTVKSRPRKMR